MLLACFVLRVPFVPINYIVEVNTAIPGNMAISHEYEFRGWAQYVITTIVSCSFFIYGRDAYECTFIWKVLGNSNKRRCA